MNSSSSHNEELEEQEPLPKLPFKRLQYALNQVVDVAIPLHVQLLKQHNENIEFLQKEGRDLELRCEQVKATKTVQLLKADLYELERLNHQVKEEDDELFHNCIKNATRDAVEILALFMDLHADIFTPLPETDTDDTTSYQNTIPPLVCNYDQQQIEDCQEALQLEQVQVVKSRFESLHFLQKELQEINALIKQFSRFVFRQKESVDNIQENVEQTGDNVLIGTEYLKKASNYKAATFPLAGAVIGGLILGPVGALVGFKIVGSIACVAGGSIIGFGAGLKLKKKQQEFNEYEMKALTYPSKSYSSSSPDLSDEQSDKKSQ